MIKLISIIQGAETL